MSSILVVLPMSRAYAGALFSDILDEFKSPLQGVDGPVRLVIKCHPLLPISSFYFRAYTFPEWISLSEKALPELLPEVAGLLYIPQTASWWEAYLRGIPVVKYRTDMLDIDSTDILDKEAILACEKTTLRSTLIELTRRPHGAKPGATILERVYGKVREEDWKKILS